MTEEKKESDNFLEALGAFVCIVFVLFLAGLPGHAIGRYIERNKVVNELCKKKQYDFCEVKGIDYKLKTNRDKGE